MAEPKLIETGSFGGITVTVHADNVEIEGITPTSEYNVTWWEHLTVGSATELRDVLTDFIESQ